MKLKRLKFSKYSFFKLCLLTFGNQNFTDENLESNLKYLLKTLYNFHYSRKRLLFIIPKYFYENKYTVYIKNSDHYVFFKESWVNGFICNRKYVLRDGVESSKSFKKLLDIDVIIIFDVTKKDRVLLNELRSLDVPIICCGISSQKIFNRKNFFFGCFQKVNKKSLELCWFLVSLLIKR